MTHVTHLWLFFLMVLGIIALPGLDMAFVVASAWAGGRRSGLMAVAGIVTGGVCHVLAGVMGIAVLLRLLPWLSDALLIAGGTYIAWIGWSVLPSESTFGAVPVLSGVSMWATFRRAAITCLLNPKAYLFMLAIFPQFLRPEYGSIGVQAVALGLIIATTQTLVYGSIALLSSGARGWMAARPGFGSLLRRVVGTVLLAGAALTVAEGLRRI